MRGECIYLQVLVQMYLRGLSSHELAERTGIAYPSLRRKLRGVTPLTLDEAMEIWAVLQRPMPLETLFARKEQAHDA